MNKLTTLKILETFGQNTTLKARAILSDYLQKSFTVRGAILDVSETFPRVVCVRLRPSDCPEHRPFEIAANFSAGSEVPENLLKLKKGEVVTVCGLIDYITPQSMSLRSCEIFNEESAKLKTA